MNKAKNTGLDIGAAVTALKNGKRVAREGWSSDSCLYLNVSGLQAGGTALISVAPKTGYAIGAWNPSQADLMATDWRVVG